MYSEYDASGGHMIPEYSSSLSSKYIWVHGMGK